MEKYAEVGKNLSEILQNMMAQYWDQLNGAPDVPDEEFEKLCNLGCDLEQVLEDYRDKILNTH
ncbi:MAG: hypothetical protein ACLU8W_11370 [Clostridia bacterium]